MIHDGLSVDADQLHPVPAVTETDRAPPSAGSDCVVGDTEKEHGATPFCVTDTVRPSTVSDVVRGDVVVLGLALSDTDPVPDPVAAVIDSHEAPLVAVQAQPAGDVTTTDDVPPAAGTVRLTGDALKEHATPACVIAIVCPATVNVPERGEELALAATAIETLAPPVPLVELAPPANESHVGLLDTAVH